MYVSVKSYQWYSFNLLLVASLFGSSRQTSRLRYIDRLFIQCSRSKYIKQNYSNFFDSFRFFVCMEMFKINIFLLNITFNFTTGLALPSFNQFSCSYLMQPSVLLLFKYRILIQHLSSLNWDVSDILTMSEDFHPLSYFLQLKIR